MNAHGHYVRTKRYKKRDGFDWLIRLSIVGAPLMTIPQIYAIWITKSVGASLATWLAYTANAGIWLVYGVKHRERSLVFAQIIWVVVDTLVVVGLLRYK